ncbi:radical SAM protein [Candidatus Woesearchaeota archaeon]|jgi:radical SAM superfamily enzyme with C-terminal helix-hairpin-helix motif|nr:radical SAM protein [Candidatus Woesearchaeota archaeon]MDP6648003.1 radical SAM protein [Candidatus Woesearchaeota archaeon]|tara:strand:- start:42827 stop:44317 length:1491 start_codon:yes stop_codon:yes gene_type:complete
MKYTILDCYTDEPAGLGVPPYLGTYPRYIAGYLDEDVHYLTIDDLRLWRKHNSRVKETKPSQKTDITTYNLTSNYKDVKKILEETDTLIVVLGIHVPGKYLSAVPGTLHEIMPLIKDLKCKKILTGPAVFGTQLHGGKFREKADLTLFDKIDYSLFRFKYSDVKDYSVEGAQILKQIPDYRMIEIETGHGCDIGKCSFCTEPIKNRVEFRDKDDVLKEITEFYKLGARFFRLGKQTCFYTLPYAIDLLKEIRKNCPELKVLHIDNVNPVKVVMDKNHEITKAVVKYCTSGNIAAFGIESFDMEVVKANTLNTAPNIAYEAIRILNKYGADTGQDGMPRYLPGINIIFGLRAESKKTHEENMKWLKKIYDEGLMLRRINIRQVAIFEGTSLYNEGKDKFLRKNKKFYWKWRNDIRQNIDWPMLQRIVPRETVLTNCYAEIYDGKTTFCRQFGTYPLIVGVKGRLELKKFYDIEITGHMLRSITGKVVIKKEIEDVNF